MTGFGKHEPPNHKGRTDVWLTPIEIIKNLGDNFDLDPCGESFHRTAKQIYTENGLIKPWKGNVWLNPPYSQVSDWLEKLSKHNNGTALVFARTDTKWAQKAMREAVSIFFLKGRVKFLKYDKSLHKSGNAGAPSMFLTFGYSCDFSNFEGYKCK